MKIAFIGARGIPYGYSSAEQISLNVGKRLVDRGHEFTVYCRSGLFEDHSASYEGVRRVFLPTIEHKLFGQVIHGTLSGIHSIFRDFDVVHFQCLTNTFQSIIPWLIKRNTVINVDGQEWDDPKWPKTLRHVFYKTAIYFTLAMQKDFITDAQGMFDLYQERYHRKSTIIEYGADIVSSKNPEILKNYGLSPKSYYFVGARLVPGNQLDLIVEGFNRSGSDKFLVVAGGGDGGSEWFHKVKENSGSRVKFLGMVSNQTHMDELYSNAYGYLHGAFRGGINSALLRPLGAGCPSLAFDTVFNREVLQMNDNSCCGLLWKNVDELVAGIQQLDCSPELVDKLSKQSVTQIKRNFSWDLVADQYEIFYKGHVEKWSAEKIRMEVANQKEKYSCSL